MVTETGKILIKFDFSLITQSNKIQFSPAMQIVHFTDSCLL